MRILITNDDGITAPGIEVLARHVVRWMASGPTGEVREALVVAPSSNYSGMSAAGGDVFHKPSIAYRRHKIPGAESIDAYSLDAPPALCAIIGAIGSFDFQPDLILSGINAGANVGRSVLHSGTVGAIFTGSLLGLSGLAVSVQWDDDVHYETAGAVAVEVLQEFLHAPPCTLLNLNVPNLAAKDLKGVRRGRISTAGVVKSASPRIHDGSISDEGEITLRFGAASPELGDVSDEDADEDGALLAAGYASLTPVVGPHENVDTALDDLMHAALSTIARHLVQQRETSD